MVRDGAVLRRQPLGQWQGIYNYQQEADTLLRTMRHRPLMTGTTPFRIHPEDPPFEPPAEPWPSPNNRAEQAQAARRGRPWPPLPAAARPSRSAPGP